MISPILFQILKEVSFGLIQFERMLLYGVIIILVVVTTLLSIGTSKILRTKLAYFVPQILFITGIFVYSFYYSKNLDGWESLGLFWGIILTIYVSLFSVPTFMIYKDKLNR